MCFRGKFRYEKVLTIRRPIIDGCSVYRRNRTGQWLLSASLSRPNKDLLLFRVHCRSSATIGESLSIRERLLPKRPVTSSRTGERKLCAVTRKSVNISVNSWRSDWLATTREPPPRRVEWKHPKSLDVCFSGEGHSFAVPGNSEIAVQT